MKRSTFLFLVGLSAAGVADTLLGGNPRFRRGDANDDGSLDLTDATYTLGYLFLGKPKSLGCLDAADSNDDGTLDISDAVRSLGFLFLGDPPPPPPFGECEFDPTPDRLRCAAFAGCELTPPNGGLVFAEPVTYGTGEGPVCTVLGDLNADGALDVAVANYRTDDVSVLLGVGDGTFGEAARYGVGDGPRSIAIGDINADGALDVAVANYLSNDLTILLGAGDGSFGPAASRGVGRSPSSLVLGDFDVDGALDLAVADGYGDRYSRIFILLGTGDGTFRDTVGYNAGHLSIAMAVDDLDGDGAEDLAVANGGGGLSILLGAGDGTFSKAVMYASGRSIRSVAIGDLNGDGALDIAAASDSGEVSILIAAGNGTFGEPFGCRVGENLQSAAIGDIDGDGALDLAISDDDDVDEAVSILLGAGDGTFREPVTFGVGSSTGSVVLGDLDGDGALDLVVLKYYRNDVSILLAR